LLILEIRMIDVESKILFNIFNASFCIHERITNGHKTKQAFKHALDIFHLNFSRFNLRKRSSSSLVWLLAVSVIYVIASCKTVKTTLFIFTFCRFKIIHTSHLPNFPFLIQCSSVPVDLVNYLDLHRQWSTTLRDRFSASGSVLLRDEEILPHTNTLKIKWTICRWTFSLLEECRDYNMSLPSPVNCLKLFEKYLKINVKWNERFII